MYNKIFCIAYNEIMDDVFCLRCEYRTKQDLRYEEREECIFFEKIKE